MAEQRGWEALRAIDWTIQSPRPQPRGGGDARGAGGVQKKLAEAVAEEAERHPGAAIEAFATDEHRIGLKPILRRVWAPRGERPIARGHHRYEWFYVTAFVSPATGESFWYLSTGVDKELFEDTLALFAREAGAGRDRIILLVLDGAGWHTAPGLAVPEGIRLVYLPPYTPELQPAETLWVHVDEPIVNRHFDTLADLDAVVAARCVALENDRDLIRGQAGFHWWPNRPTRSNHPETVLLCTSPGGREADRPRPKGGTAATGTQAEELTEEGLIPAAASCLRRNPPFGERPSPAPSDKVEERSAPRGRNQRARGVGRAVSSRGTAHDGRPTSGDSGSERRWSRLTPFSAGLP